MAFTPSLTGIRQSAQRNAAELTSAFVTAKLLKSEDDVWAFFQETQERFFQDLKVVADPEIAAAAKSGGQRKGSTGGRKSGGAGRPTRQDAVNTRIKGGAFDTLTLGQVVALDEDEASNYGYTRGDGRSYLEWMASDAYNNEYMKTRAKLVLSPPATGGVRKPETDADGTGEELEEDGFKFPEV